ncbi:hypothetical protein IAT38_006530 [Cryptococcus sp. DSM 104549]
MAYASSSRQLPRESIYPAPPSGNYLNALEDCVQATEGCARTLQAGIDKFEPGVRDLPRLTKVFKHKHHFLVLPEPTIMAHKSALAASLAPQIDQLIAKAEGAVDAEQTKVAHMEERLRILESARLPAPEPIRPSSSGLPGGANTASQKTDTSCKIADLNVKELSILQRKKMMMLKQKRERLEKEMARLSVEAA